jgi:ferredoxin
LSTGEGRGSIRVIVDDEQCAQTGRCIYSAPTVFSHDSDGLMTFAEYPPDSDRSGVADAVALCPMQAIRAEYAVTRPTSS